MADKAKRRKAALVAGAAGEDVLDTTARVATSKGMRLRGRADALLDRAMRFSSKSRAAWEEAESLADLARKYSAHDRGMQVGFDAAADKLYGKAARLGRQASKAERLSKELLHLSNPPVAKGNLLLAAKRGLHLGGILGIVAGEAMDPTAVSEGDPGIKQPSGTKAAMRKARAKGRLAQRKADRGL